VGINDYKYGLFPLGELLLCPQRIVGVILMAEDIIETRLREVEHTILRIEGMVDSGDQLIRAELKLLKSEADNLRLEVADKVHVQRYVIVERIVFGLVTLTLTAVFAAVIALVVSSGGGVVS